MPHSHTLRARRVTTAVFGLLLLAGCGGSDSAAIAPTPTPVAEQIRTASGTVQGSKVDASGILAYKGIPFAAPPVGDLRWQAPQPVASWTSTLDATKFGPNCWAANVTGGPIATQGVSEDCLYLNVWTGAASSSEKRPVMVFLHGGGFEIGNVTGAGSDGTAFAKKGVVLVTVNYRLGVFGYLASPELDAEGGSKFSGNYGLLDMLSSLEWVKRNIEAFGGDPNNVTVFGSSAGAHAIGMFMASPAAAGLFHKGIAQSGAFWESEHGVMRPRQEMFKMGAALAAKLGRSSLASMRAVPALELQTASSWNALTDPAVTAFSPMIDGYVLTENPYVTFLRGRQNKMPLMAGWNLREGLPFVSRSLPHGTVQEYADSVASLVGPQNAAEFLRLYPGATVEQATASGELFIGDMLRYSIWGWGNEHVRSGTPVYLYNYSYSSPYAPIPQHGAEGQFTWGNLAATGPSAADRALAEQMQSYWVNFAKTGSPNGTRLPSWPRYDGVGGQVLSFGSTIAPAQPEGLERFKFLDKFRVDGVWTLNQLKP